MLCAGVWISAEFLYRGLSLSSKLSVSFTLRKICVYLGVMLLYRHRAIIWYAFGVAWLNSRGWGCCKVWWVFTLLYMQFVCAVCKKAMTHSFHNVPSQQAVKLVVVGLGFVEKCWFRLFLGDQLQWKMGLTCGNGFAIAEAKLSLKMPYFPD